MSGDRLSSLKRFNGSCPVLVSFYYYFLILCGFYGYAIWTSAIALMLESSQVIFLQTKNNPTI